MWEPIPFDSLLPLGAIFYTTFTHLVSLSTENTLLSLTSNDIFIPLLTTSAQWLLWAWPPFFNAYFIPERLLAGNPFSIFMDTLKIRSLFAWVMICHKSWKSHTYKMTQTSAFTDKQNSHPTQPKLVDLTDKIRFEKWSKFFTPSISFLGFVSVNSCCQ